MTTRGSAVPAVPAVPAPAPAPVSVSAGAATAGGLPRRLREVGDRLPVAVVLLVLAGQLLMPGGWQAHGSLTAAAVALGLLAGLPHGAVDHLVPAWALARRLSPAVLLGLLAGYLLVAGAMLAVLLVAPLAGLAAFLVLSVLHFGTGEVAHADLRPAPQAAARPAPGAAPRPAGGCDRALRALRAVSVLAWGGSAVLLPLARWPDQVAPVLEALAPGSSGLATAAVRGAVGAAVLVAVAISAYADLRAGRTRPAAERALLVALFVLVPPLVAFACWFGGWHAVRHLVRLLAADPGNREELGRDRLGGPLRRFARQAAVPTGGALLALVLLLVLAAGRTTVLAAALTVLAALTVPHMLTVAWWDWRNRLPLG